MKYYVVVHDRQGGEFGMDRVYTAKEWGEQAFEWADSDDYEKPSEWLLENHKSEKGLICDIADWWELTFAVVDESQKRIIERYVSQIDLLEGMIMSADFNNDSEYKRKLVAQRNKIKDKYYDFLETLTEV